MSIRWITPYLGTAPALEVDVGEDLNIIDVRDLVDKAGNNTNTVLSKITAGCESLKSGKKTVICCDYGISRSNAIAVGVLAKYESISFESAVKRVLQATGEREIKADPLQSVRFALGGGEKTTNQKKRILVTGGNGTIGKPVCLALSEEFDVFSPNRNDLDLRLGSSQLDLFIGENAIDYVIHLANPRVYTSNNAIGETLTMLRNVIDICITRSIKLIYLSGWEVYSGYATTHLLADESLPLLPKGPYGEAKYLAELLIEHSRKTQGLNCLMLRSGPVYGIGSDKPKFIFNFIDKLKRNEQVYTHHYLNGWPSLDLLYINDFVSIIKKAVRADFSGNMNIGTGELTSTRKIAESLKTILNSNSSIESTHIEAFTACIAMNSSFAKEKLDWTPLIGVNQGLQMIVENIK